MIRCLIVSLLWTSVVVGAEGPRAIAVERALTFLRGQQGADGGIAGDRHRTALTALACLAHLSAGHPPNDAVHGRWIGEALRFLIRQQDDTGYFGSRDNSRMYGHGITVLTLAQAMGMTGDEMLEEDLRQVLIRAVALTVDAARIEKPPQHAGGWRYSPTDRSSDLSLSGWQLMSLHAAQTVGVQVPQTVVDAAIAYAARMTGADGRVGYDKPEADHPALRGVGILCAAIGRAGDAPEIARVVDRMRGDPLTWRGPWFFYRAYYDAVGLSRAAPEKWEADLSRIEDLLIERQRDDGSWPEPPGDNEGQHGSVYRTAMAAMALCVRHGVLPAYER